MGLCFGGSQIGLGLSALTVGFGVLWGLRELEMKIHQDRHATLTLVLDQNGLSDPEIRSELHANGFHVESCTSVNYPKQARHELEYLLKWRGHTDPSSIPQISEKLSQGKGVSKIEWRPMEIPKS